ncbi:glycoside hydrolase family 25 protein [Caproicibacterium lactatifermentans]|jgi:lysozyme|uniref:glycoside hydrolase family 25 protein n=1 Tax=Caproicibacterium lactatifermentans TaxID=2666138 RepID=UPI003D8D5DFD
MSRYVRSPRVQKRIRKQRRRLLLAAGAVVLAIVLLLTAILHSCSSHKNAEEQVSSSIVEDMIIQDRYEGEKIIPKYAVAKNTLFDSKFSALNGITSYAGAVNGVDVSSWQGSIDWKEVKASGMDFVMIRVGYRGQTTGTIQADSRFTENMKGALSAGLKVGVYFYSQAISKAEAEKEADYVIQQIKPYQVTWPVVFDWEPGNDETISTISEAGGLRTNSETPEEVTQYTAAFCKRIQAAGYKPAYYCNKTMGYTVFDLKELEAYQIWYAEYKNLPSFYYHFNIWQYTQKGKINGITGTVDLNISFQKYA